MILTPSRYAVPVDLVGLQIECGPFELGQLSVHLHMLVRERALALDQVDHLLGRLHFGRLLRRRSGRCTQVNKVVLFDCVLFGDILVMNRQIRSVHYSAFCSEIDLIVFG